MSLEHHDAIKQIEKLKTRRIALSNGDNPVQTYISTEEHGSVLIENKEVVPVNESLLIKYTLLMSKDSPSATKLCQQNNFVAEGNSNYMKDNYDVKLLQWVKKIIS